MFMAYAGRDHLTNVTSSQSAASPVIIARVTQIPVRAEALGCGML